MNLELLIQELQALRKDVDRSEARLFLRAHEIEIRNRVMWSESYATFDLLLKDCRICDPTRYREFMAARVLDAAISKQTEAMGVGSVIVAGKILNPERRAAFIEAAVTRAKETGVPWSDQQARHASLKIAGSKPKNSRWNSVAGEVRNLKVENIALKRRVRELEAEVRTLQAENKRLREKCGKGKSARAEQRSPS